MRNNSFLLFFIIVVTMPGYRQNNFSEVLLKDDFSALDTGLFSAPVEEYFVHNPNVTEGGVYDGWGRKVLQFPDDGHPDYSIN